MDRPDASEPAETSDSTTLDYAQGYIDPSVLYAGIRTVRRVLIVMTIVSGTVNGIKTPIDWARTNGFTSAPFEWTPVRLVEESLIIGGALFVVGGVLLGSNRPASVWFRRIGVM